MKKVLVLLGHPRRDSFCSALMDQYIEGLKKGGKEIKTLYLDEIKFDPDHIGKKGEKENLEPDLKETQEKISWADHMTFIFPNWWGYMPARFKAFIDRTFAMGFAMSYTPKGPIGLLKGKTARIINTMDTPPLIYRFLLGDAGINVLKKCVLFLCGVRKIKVNRIGSVYTSNDDKKKKWLEKMYLTGKNE